MHHKHALVRRISSRFAECNLTHIEAQSIDLDLARKQHADYVRALKSMSLGIIELPELEEAPDGVFVEDTALVFPELAIIANPAAESRKLETASVINELKNHRPLHLLPSEATLDGGDVLVNGRTIYVGLSSRTNEIAFRALSKILEPHGYAVHSVPVERCLHLKTGCTFATSDILIGNPAWIDLDRFDAETKIEVMPAEAASANLLIVGEYILMNEDSPCLYACLQEEFVRRAISPQILTVDISEIQKAEAGLTCMSILLH